MLDSQVSHIYIYIVDVLILSNVFNHFPSRPQEPQQQALAVPADAKKAKKRNEGSSAKSFTCVFCGGLFQERGWQQTMQGFSDAIYPGVTTMKQCIDAFFVSLTFH